MLVLFDMTSKKIKFPLIFPTDVETLFGLFHNVFVVGAFSCIAGVINI